MKNHSPALFILSVLCGTLSSCDSKQPAPTASASAVAATAVALLAAAPSTNGVPSQVTRIIFVGKEHACDCTRKKVETAQAALAQVLGQPAKIPVEILKADLEPEKVEPYRQQRPMMALPAIYFVDAKNAVVQVLQGEVTVEQIAAALEQRHAGAPPG